MFTPKFIKNDWVKRKGNSQLMQIEEYQIEEEERGTTKFGLKLTDRHYNGKVWCCWTNKNNAVVTEPFYESELEAVKWIDEPALARQV